MMLEYENKMTNKGDYIIYVDESGDHGLEKVDKEYPIFVLSFCCFRISEYIKDIVPKIQEFKFKYFGHDQIILHETDIRKSKEPYLFLRKDKLFRNKFLTDLTNIISESNFRIFSAVIDKNKLNSKYKYPFNPYHLGLLFGLEKLNEFFYSKKQEGKEIYLVFEKRGKNEDRDLELEFYRICSDKQFGYKRTDFTRINYKFLLSDKKSNSCGLQLADLTARPIGMKYLKPDQINRAYETLESKIQKHKNFP